MSYMFKILISVDQCNFITAAITSVMLTSIEDMPSAMYMYSVFRN